MRVKMILPALTEARSPFFRPIKYSLFPPLGLAQLAAYFGPDDEIRLQDEHVETLDLDDSPDLVVIQVYITSAYRSYQLADHYRARGAYVCLGGLHVTSLPDEAAAHADTIFLGPGEDTWPQFLADYRAGRPGPRYQSTVRTLIGAPPFRRDLIKRHLYLVPNSIVVSRGCPHACDFCYKEAFFEGGTSFYTLAVDDALAEIDRLPGKHLYFLDDHLFGHPRFAAALFEGMKGMGRLWQAAGTVKSVLQPDLLEKAVACGLRSLFVGFETLSPANLQEHHKYQNLDRDYSAAIRRLHDLGVMVNGSFVFGMDGDDPSVFERTVDWAIGQGIETATFHILTPYPGTGLHRRMQAEGRITSENWDRYDTRHVVYRPARLTPEELEAGYWRAYRDFYRWGSIFRGAATKDRWLDRARHVAYAGGWKKLEPMWDAIIRAKRATGMLPVLESVLSGFGQYRAGRETPVHFPSPPTPLPQGERGVATGTPPPTPLPQGERGVATGMPPGPPPGTPPPTPLPQGERGVATVRSVPPARRSGGPTGLGSEGASEHLPLELTVAAAPAGEGRPTFVPLALAIDLGMTDPVGTIKTRSVLLGTSGMVQPRISPTAPARAASKPVAGRGRRLIRGPWTAPTIPPMDAPAARKPAARGSATPPPPGRPKLTLLPGLPD
ncbi:MAG: B12-binding domain-containing radical SAM protein [Chloroflexi bacterium]|nr:B12-binding domain-containing radical SAM protein [Chloroflexota bacterium]